MKEDYRSFLNQGSEQQEATAPLGDRFNFLKSRISKFDKNELGVAFDALLRRISYVEYFARVVDYVPSELPYEHGTLWLGAIRHIVTPRLLFPNKPVLHDSYTTRKYTGTEVAGPETGTSIGVGYIAESYIDFGPMLMFIPILLVGILYGGMYKYFVSNNKQPVIAHGLAIAIFYPLYGGIGTTNAKLIGGAITVTIAMLALNYFLGATIMSWLRPPMVRRRSFRRRQ